MLLSRIFSQHSKRRARRGPIRETAPRFSYKTTFYRFVVRGPWRPARCCEMQFHMCRCILDAWRAQLGSHVAAFLLNWMPAHRWRSRLLHFHLRLPFPLPVPRSFPSHFFLSPGDISRIWSLNGFAAIARSFRNFSDAILQSLKHTPRNWRIYWKRDCDIIVAISRWEAASISRVSSRNPRCVSTLKSIARFLIPFRTRRLHKAY